MPEQIPIDLEAEESVLGAMILSADASHQATTILCPEDFYRKSHGTIYRSISLMRSAGQPVDPVTLTDNLKSAGKLEEVGDRAYVYSLIGTCPNSRNARVYAEQVKRVSMRRQLIAVCQRFEALAGTRTSDVDLLLADLEREVYTMGEGLRREQVTHISAPLTESYERMQRAVKVGNRITGLPTGFRELDGLTCGLQPGNLVVIGGRTSMGKTSFVLNIAHHAAVRLHVPVLVFSMEMSRVEVATRLLLQEAQVDSNAYLAGRMNDRQLMRIEEAREKIEAAPVMIDDEGDRSLPEIRAIARRHVAKAGVKLVIVDYIQQMYSDQRQESRAQEVARIAREFKVMARELEVPILAVSQLRRPPQQVARKEPSMEDLKESGGIEQSADAVILLYRPEVDDDDPDKRGVAKIQLAKQRNGPTGRITLFWVGGHCTFLNSNPDDI